MGLFNKKSRETLGEHLPEFIPAECIGQKCPNYNGQACADTGAEWITAGGPTEERDTTKPPLRDEATYIIYGQYCLAADERKLVAQRVEVFKPEEVSTMMLLAQTDMPVEIVSGDAVSNVVTVASSE